MLKRIYLDNYGCLVNFDLPLSRTTLLLGLNGSGKTTVFEGLRAIQKFISGEARADDVFAESTRTRWDTRLVQTLELEIQGPKGKYEYKLVIEHDEKQRSDRSRVKSERLTLEGNPLFFSDEEGNTHLFRDDFKAGPVYPSFWRQSGLSIIMELHDNTSLTWFKEHLRRLLIVSLKPDQMRPETPGDNEHLLPGAENFASWYQYLSQEHQKVTHELRLKIADLFPNFRQLHLPKSGDRWVLKTEFSAHGNGSGKSISFSFNELSDGQRALIVLYALLLAAPEAGYTLVLDEPENFVGLSELQPWLMELKDLCADSDVQALLISHHPEVIDYLGPEHGVWLERDDGGPTRIKGLPVDSQSGLKLSELIERGWEHNGQT